MANPGMGASNPTMQDAIGKLFVQPPPSPPPGPMPAPRAGGIHQDPQNMQGAIDKLAPGKWTAPPVAPAPGWMTLQGAGGQIPTMLPQTTDLWAGPPGSAQDVLNKLRGSGDYQSSSPFREIVRPGDVQGPSPYDMQKLLAAAAPAPQGRQPLSAGRTTMAEKIAAKKKAGTWGKPQASSTGTRGR